VLLDDVFAVSGDLPVRLPVEGDIDAFAWRSARGARRLGARTRRDYREEHHHEEQKRRWFTLRRRHGAA
jgi:hypothetical protein